MFIVKTTLLVLLFKCTSSFKYNIAPLYKVKTYSYFKSNVFWIYLTFGRYIVIGMCETILLVLIDFPINNLIIFSIIELLGIKNSNQCTIQ